MEIDKKNRTDLKAFFVKNAIPTEGQFADLIDGMLNQRDDGVVKPPGSPLCIEASGDATSQKKVINFYESFADANPAWVLSLNPRSKAADPATAKAGFSIGDGAGNSRLFVEKGTGNIGIGTIEPKNQLDIQANPRTGEHAANRALYVTGNFGPAEGVEFRHSNGTQGIGFGFNTIYATGSNPTQHLVLRARGDGSIIVPEDNLAFGTKTRQMVNLWSNQYGIGVQASTTYFRTATSFAWYRGGSHSDNERNAGGGAAVMVIDGAGRVGINTPQPANRLDVYGDPRTGAHPSGKALYVTGNFDQADGVEFRHSNGSQGIGFGYNTIYATGGNANQDLSLKARGSGSVRVLESPLNVEGNDVNIVGGRYRRLKIVSDTYWAGIELVAREAANAHPHIDFTHGDLDSPNFGVRLYSPANGLLEVSGGNLKVPKLQLGNKWLLSGEGDAHANDGWLRMMNYQGTDYWGGLATGTLWLKDKNIQGSDRRLKKSIRKIENCLEKLSAINGIRFQWEEKADPEPTEIGLLADDVEKVFPELVETGPDGMKALNYSGLIGPIVEAIKEQQAQIEALKAELSRQQAAGAAPA